MRNDDARAVADRISKRFFATQALDHVTVAFFAGEVHALVGENGAGKSTLMKIFAGVYRPDSGEVRLDGKSVAFDAPRDAIRAGAIVIPQEMHVVGAQSVAENVLLGALPNRTVCGIPVRLDRSQMRRRTRELLNRFAIDLDPDQSVANLGIGERQIVMIARALNHNARFLIFDEPTAALETREAERLLDIIRKLKELGVAVAYVSHNLDEVDAIADRCTILRDGRVIAHSAGQHCPTRDEMVRLMTGRDIEHVPGGGKRGLGQPLLKLDRVGRAPYRQLGIALHRGEILGLAGLLGAGMTELLRAIYGAQEPPQSIQLNDFRIDISSPADAIKHGIGLVPRERRQGLIMGLTVRENIVLPNLDKFAGLRGLDIARIDRFVSDLIASVDIRPHDPAKVVRELSGGNQQKVIFARWLAGHVDLLLLDEPTHGIDVGAKAQIHGLMHGFADRGGGIVFATSEMAEVLAESDRVLVMRAGTIVAQISRQDDYSERALHSAMAG